MIVCCGLSEWEVLFFISHCDFFDGEEAHIDIIKTYY